MRTTLKITRAWVSIAVFMLFIVCLLPGCTPSGGNSSEKQVATEEAAKDDNQFAIGELAKDFTLADLSGKEVNLNGLKGKYVVIHFATTWCPFCNAEAPYLESLYQNYKEKGVEVLIVDVKEDNALVTEKLQDKFNFTFPVLLDSDGVVAASYCPPEAQPDLARDEVMIASNLLIDPEGKIRFFSLLDSEGFDAKLTALETRLNELLTAS